ncbi:Mitochondrial folate transporter/carrier [Chionoecetes opilio]|uniref:Mitochondrial folate transporter/carrier n=1 Tax=Chionoecetes opilio TaxID=41210 RepID=A0A8J4XM45_CHIOP|nr:Mitochondrial folate transporter/carrier [Chionoecetes opilio]
MSTGRVSLYAIEPTGTKLNGILGFYKGLSPNLMRVVPATAITFLVYEKSSHFLLQRRDDASPASQDPASTSQDPASTSQDPSSTSQDKSSTSQNTARHLEAPQKEDK